MDAAEETEEYPERPHVPASPCLSMQSDDIPHDLKEAADSLVKFEKSNLPASSCLSMKSDNSMDIRHDFRNEQAESVINLQKSDQTVSSRLSMKSDNSMDIRHDFTKEQAQSSRDHPDWSESKEMDGNAIFKLVGEHAQRILLRELKSYEMILFPHTSQTCVSENQDEEGLTSKDKRQDDSVSEGVLKITLHVLKEIGHTTLASKLEKHIYGSLDVCQRKLRNKLKKFEYIYEGIGQHGNQTLLNKVYTELYITEGVSQSVNKEHEVRQIEAAARRRATEDTPIKCEDIFKPLLGQDKIIRVVLTTGIAGIGKTISVHKFNLDWAEGRVNQDIQLLMNLPFRELNLMSERRYTLTQLLHHFLSEAKESGISDFGKYKLVLIFDGLDECRLPLDFKHNEPCCSVLEPALVDVLLTNLFKGTLLHTAHIWVTSRPAAANRIPGDFVNRVTEIRGFNDPQKEEYIMKKISDPNMASRVLSHIKSTRSLHIMCHIPVFSWISATVLQRIFEEPERKDGATREMPETLTQMYTHFVVYNTVKRSWKHSEEQEASGTQDMILKLGKLAFDHLMKGNLIFYENELNEYSINVDDAVIHSGMFSQISKYDFGLFLERVFCFVHMSIQEYFSAMYTTNTFICSGQNLIETQGATTLPEAPSELTSLLKSAVDRALQSENGHLDLFLRFLLGLSQTSNQTLVNSLLPTMGSSSPNNEEIVEYIKEKIRQTPSPERCINLFHCLNELNDQSLVEEVQNYMSSGSLSQTTLSPSHWSALAFVLLTSEEKLDEFDLRKYSRSEESLLRLLPVIKESRVALLKECNLTEESCKALGAVLSNSCLKELDLSDNDLQDSGVELLSTGLASLTCQLEKLRLSFCGITEVGCGSLARALRSNSAHLKELDLSYNHAGQKGIELLSSVQNDIEHLTLRLNDNAECYLKSALKKYACQLTMDRNTAHSHLSFSEDNKEMTHMETPQPYPDSPERFTDWGQVLCKEGLSARSYWEVEWTGDWIGIGVAYNGISRKAKGNDCVLGYNDQSWSLRYCRREYTAGYNKNIASISVPYFNTRRVGVFLDWPAGTLSFYAVSPCTMTHLHTFHTEFSEPLYPGFRLGFPGSSLILCHPEHP